MKTKEITFAITLLLQHQQSKPFYPELAMVNIPTKFLHTTNNLAAFDFSSSWNRKFCIDWVSISTNPSILIPFDEFNIGVISVTHS